MPLSTGTGDYGETGLFGKRRVPKDHVRIEAYGTIDELNCLLGVLRAEELDAEFDEALKRLQNALFEVGADLATEGGKACVSSMIELIGQVEGWTEASEKGLEPLSTFVLPAGHRVAAQLHVVRAVARRAERTYWTLASGAPDVPREIGVFLNRLSDLFFSWARRANNRAGIVDQPWQRLGR